MEPVEVRACGGRASVLDLAFALDLVFIGEPGMGKHL